MRVVGHGVDIQEMKRIEHLLSNPERDWLDGVFTEAEQKSSDAPPRTTSYYAGGYAAKEAVAKALGTGFSGDVAWLDIEILRLPTGRPSIRLIAGADDVAKQLGITGWLLSISHSGDYAIASAIGVSDD